MKLRTILKHLWAIFLFFNYINCKIYKDCFLRDTDIKDFESMLNNMKNIASKISTKDPMESWKKNLESQFNEKEKENTDLKTIKKMKHCFAVLPEQLENYRITVMATSIKSSKIIQNVMNTNMNDAKQKSYHHFQKLIEISKSEGPVAFCSEYEKIKDKFNNYFINLMCDQLKYNKKVS